MEHQKIYRFKFGESFVAELNAFSKIHQYDQRSDFKQAWNDWLDDNSDLVETESRRLTTLGYEGDVVDKMFKSARYYYRKKGAEKKEPKKRHPYVGIQKELLTAMDEHILANSGLKPAVGFVDFCMNKQHIELLRAEVLSLLDVGVGCADMQSKIKKTYKNRYFILINS